MNTKIIVLLALAVVVLGGWYMFKQSGSGDMLPVPQSIAVGEQNPSAPAPDTTPAPTTSPSKVKEFTVTGGNYFFKPSVITVNKGDTVKITFVNSGGFHDFKLDEFNVATPRVQDGQSATVTFLADKAGSFEYYCSVGSHRAMGMKGTLTVK